ncbi:MAG: nicotinamidase [Solirubrobacteraceae bacterium]
MPEALLIVDVQNDFLPGGALAVPDGDEVIAHINELAADPRFAAVIATRDWHPPDHGSFKDKGGPWPEHCVQGTPGAELASDIERGRIDAVISTGTDPDADGYSGFENEELRELLRQEQVVAVTIVGLATDVCVLHTARDALREGLVVTIETAGTRGIEPESTEAALKELGDAGAQIK